jgi:hypothetical protein
MLLPALKKARDNARIILCTNNMKQQMIVYVAYANDNSGMFPYNYIPSVPHPASCYGYFKFLKPIYPDYVKNADIFYCPGQYTPVFDGIVLTADKYFNYSDPGALGVELGYWYFPYTQYGNPAYEYPYQLSRKGKFADIIVTDRYSVTKDMSSHGCPMKINTLYRDGHVKMRMPPEAWLKDLF